jgi:hypothetical protein
MKKTAKTIPSVVIIETLKSREIDFMTIRKYEQKLLSTE